MIQRSPSLIVSDGFWQFATATSRQFVKRKSGFPPKLTRDLGRMLRTVPGTSSSGLICLHTGNTGICPSARPIGYVLS